LRVRQLEQQRMAQDAEFQRQLEQIELRKQNELARLHAISDQIDEALGKGGRVIDQAPDLAQIEDKEQTS
jgi:hypothetical protein